MAAGGRLDDEDHDAEGAPTEGPDPRAQALAVLDQRELDALVYLESRRDLNQGYAPVAKATSDRFFQLFLRGLSTEDIRVLTGFQLAQVVECRVNHGWDVRRQGYDLQLMTDGVDAVKRAQLETALLAADMLAASAKMNRERIHRYFATGNENELGDLSITSIRSLKETLDVLMTATKQNAPGKAEAPPAPLAHPTSSAAPRRLLEGQVVVERSVVDLARERKLAKVRKHA